MGKIGPHRPVLFIAAVTSQYPEAFHWGLQQMQQEYGPVAVTSNQFAFEETSYYEKTMGPDLLKQFWVFKKLIDPDQMPAVKHFSNNLEAEFRKQNDFPVDRPLNIDPGYLTEAKLVLATTKDRDHRIYLAQGIYAEVTLYYHRGSWASRPWTYPDYQRQDFQEFFSQGRVLLRKQYHQMKSTDPNGGDQS